MPSLSKFPRPFIVAGPCSAETEEQVLATARQLSGTGKIHLFRAGLWKPRTRPSSFCGVGHAGLPWLQRVRQETGLDVCTEIALPEHAEACMNQGIHSFWLGARTVSNPFSVQELADSLRGCDVCVMVKNPLHPDAELWKGALDRLLKAGITKLIIIHRGFFPFEKAGLRNIPKWEIAIEMKSSFPDIPMICDVSHMAGNRAAIPDLAQKALDLNMDGLMIESHYKPESALSDARQQLTPADLALLLASLKFRDDTAYGESHDNHLLSLRDRIDSIDEQIIHLLSHRMKIVEEMGHYKKQHNIAIVQVKRWNEIVSSLGKQARKGGLSMEFLNQVLQAIHKESIRKQSLIYKRKDA